MIKTIDANTAVSNIAYKCSDIAFIYPITPSSPMAENCDEMQSKGEKNIFGQKLIVKEMQSEGGVAGAVHGSLLNGSLTTTFTSSQGLLLMLPNMNKIAGENLPAVFHIASRSIASHALNIFCDHSDVMSVRQTGYAMLCSCNAQESQDFALASHITSLKAKVPFLHFFDGFRTSHEISKVNLIDDNDIKKIFPFEEYEKFKNSGMMVTNPKQFGTAQNPDVFFQNRMSSNIYYEKLPDLLKQTFDDIYKITNRKYNLFDYVGDKNAKTIFISLGSSSETIDEYISLEKPQGVGLIKVRLFRPFSTKDFLSQIPKNVENIIVLDRTKENGSVGEPLYLDVVTSLYENNYKANVYGGIYGLGGKEFNLDMIHSILSSLNKKTLKNHFSVGINDDITFSSIPLEKYTTKSNAYECKFYGLGSDGTVSANKNTIKIIGDNTPLFAQGYFEYDSKKSGSMTISHLRFSHNEIKSHYLINSADFIAIHNNNFINKYDILSKINKNGTLLINCTSDELSKIPNETLSQLKNNNISIYIIDAEKLAREYNLGGKINVIMQTAFFKLTNLIDYGTAICSLKQAIKKTYKNLSAEALQNNFNTIDEVGANLIKINIDDYIKTDNNNGLLRANDPLTKIFNRQGNDLSVSYFNSNGSINTNTSNIEKRDIATILPDWIPEKCIQCGQCSFVCPHAVIRPILASKDKVDPSIKSADSKIDKNCKYILQISPKDCTGCKNCANACPVKAIVMKEKHEIFDSVNKDYEASKLLTKTNPNLPDTTVMGVQYKLPYFEYCGACAGCGEAPYIKLLTQLFGNRLEIANATGCSSIYSGSYPSCPFTVDNDGLGPTWANSLFEDNAEFGYGMRISLNNKQSHITTLVDEIIDENIDNNLTNALKEWKNIKKDSKKSIESYKNIKNILTDLNINNNKINKLSSCLEDLINKSVWIIGGDGWAYDIGFGGLDEVLASGENVNILVLDTEVYSNTGGQSSKSTPYGAIAKFNSNGKQTNKKNLAQIAMTYKNVYVAQIAMGADKIQTIKALKEAENYNGPSIIIAYSPCINHGIKGGDSMNQMKLAIESGYYHLFRYNPENEKPFTLDSKQPTKDLKEYLITEKRFSKLSSDDKLEQLENARKYSKNLYNYYKKLQEDE